MRELHEYLVPDYYTDFHCKMGTCRHACCIGWPIAISMTDYFHLLSVSCSPELRRNIDVALHICEHPTEERYAQLCPRYDGNCPMRSADGKCAFHTELGEDALPNVCRLFPRGIRHDETWECSCANSCEAVLELFLRHPEPISFSRKMLQIAPPETIPEAVNFNTLGRGQDIRIHFIQLLQNRRLPLHLRLLTLGNVLYDIKKALDYKDIHKLNDILGRSPEELNVIAPSITSAHLEKGLQLMENMLQIIDQRSASIQDYGENAMKWFRNGCNPVEQYLLAKHRFENVIPNWEIIFEHMLVNHMFFQRFPFQDRPLEIDEEFRGLCAIYAMLRFLSFGWLALHSSVADFIDVCAAAFRLIEHTEFARYAAALLKQLDCYCLQDLEDLISL